MNGSPGLGHKHLWAVILAGGDEQRLPSYIHPHSGPRMSQTVFPDPRDDDALEQAVAQVRLDYRQP
jgi:hypothetical protein